MNELSKDNPPKRSESEHRRRRRRRRHHHHHSPDTSPHHATSQQLRPPQTGPPRPYSAPPPISHPTWQPQNTGPIHPQNFPQQWTQQHHPPPPSQTFAAFRPPIQQQRPNMFPPPGVHVDMKTGKVQTNMYPPDMPRNSSQGQTHDSSSSLGYPTNTSNNSRINITSNSNPSHPDIPTTISSPPNGFVELDAEIPGRYRAVNGVRQKHGSQQQRGRDMEYMRSSPPPPYRERD